MQIADLVRERGRLTVAAFMDLALNHPELGYYARAAQRSGRAGDFFTSVDVGPLFGELLEMQFAEMAQIIKSHIPDPKSQITKSKAQSPRPKTQIDLVEAGAGNGRLSADILRAAKASHPDFYDSIRLHLVETSPAARAAQPAVLGDAAEQLASSSPEIPDDFEGILLANELLDALPVHQVVMREGGLREVYVSTHGEALVAVEGSPSTDALADYLRAINVTLERGWRAEIGLTAVEWIRRAARALRRGFIVIIDYGHEARELYSEGHSSGTLTTFARHQSSEPRGAGDQPAWLKQPGEQDLTAHVDFTSVRAAAEAEGLTTLGLLDQTYFLMGIITGSKSSTGSTGSGGSTGAERMNPLNQLNPLNLKSLLLPGGLGSTHKVLILGKNVGTPPLAGCSYRIRLT